jgi:uncharacterized protein YbjT (DUF2867 family)
MRILVTGATGFIGSRVASALHEAGHDVTCAVRKPAALQRGGLRYIEADFTRDLTPQIWEPRLQGIDVVVNAVGIIREHGAQSFEALHTAAPQALFTACAAQQVGRVVQISALGADDGARSRYHLSKKAADDFLLRTGVPATIIQPSLVYGAGGASATLFNTLATMPFAVQFGDGRQMVQPVHIDDVVAAITNAVQEEGVSMQRIALVGPDAVPFVQFLAMLRESMGLRRAWHICIPIGMARALAAAAGRLSRSPLDSESFAMLERGNTADVSGTRELLGRMPRGIKQFIRTDDAAAVRLAAQWRWLAPLLRLSLSAVWIWTAIVSAFVYPQAESYALLERVGIPAALMPVMLYGAALLDLAIGLAIFFVRRKWIWAVQLVVIGFYSILIAWKLPEFLWHPYGPILKNLPMLAAIWLLMESETR